MAAGAPRPVAGRHAVDVQPRSIKSRDKPLRVFHYLHNTADDLGCCRGLHRCENFLSYTSSDKEWAHWIGWTLL